MNTIIRRANLVLSLLLLLVLKPAFVAEGALTYFTWQEVPDMLKWYPSPPDTTSAAFVYDIMCYIHGKELRLDKDRALQAIRDVNKSASGLCELYQDAFGITLSAEETPAIYSLLDHTIRTASYGAYTGKNRYRRKRPYVRFKEPTLIPGNEASLANEGSYPSSHTIVGWTAALLLSEINPQAAEAVLSIGYEFGQSRLIAGYHWHSDVVAGYVVASAVYAKCHTSGEFMRELSLAKEEFRDKSGQGSGSSPPLRILPPDMAFWYTSPPADGSAAYMFDLSQYYAGVDMRGAFENERHAMADVSCDLVSLSASFSETFGLEISEQKTPMSFEVLRRAHQSVMVGAERYQHYFGRHRPFVDLNVASLTPFLDDSLSVTFSYPSHHAALGWLFALLLEEINPEAQNALLARGYQYGESQLITGHQWQSDVDAGRMMAMTCYATLHSDEEFIALVQQARREFFNKKYVVPHKPQVDNDASGKPGDTPDADSARVATGSYSVNGIPAGEHTQGIVITGGRKVIGGY